MKMNQGRMLAIALIAAVSVGAFMANLAESPNADTPNADSMDLEERQAAAERAKDPKWKASTTQVGTIQVGEGPKSPPLKNFCLNHEGNILACIGSAVRVYSPAGKLLQTWELDLSPSAITMAPDHTIFVAGEGQVAKLDSAGRVVARGKSPVANEPVVITKELQDMIKEMAAQNRCPEAEEAARFKESLEKRRRDVTGLAATGQDVFMAVGAPSDFSYRVYRFDHALENSKLVVEKLRGCCSQMDIQARDEKLYISHNARHSVEARDRDGKELSKFGTKGKVKATDFGGCCEPKNVRVLGNGDILAAESGPPTCIKRFSADGAFKEVVAVLDSKGDCVRVTVEVSPDGGRYYLLDTTRNAIRIFQAID